MDAWWASWLPSYHPSQVGFEVFCVGKLLAVPVLLILKPRLGLLLQLQPSPLAFHRSPLTPTLTLTLTLTLP